MSATGYAKKTLVQKLGIKPGSRLAVFHAPPDFQLGLKRLPTGARIVQSGYDLDIVHYFSAHRQALASALPGLKARIKPAGAIWISWPKRAAKVKTDLDENIVRHLALQQGLVDIKVVAIDATWSGLKLVIPVRLRPPLGRS